ncbi:hypothetical protein PR048_026097 [Dryococelus australis]|uniref:SGNH hydrolase-type esterase domain-containing protein n=1 Tax=Dryococelus australis TaxID=614101 RepID=A0ABQ9GKC9_9NEOP|nr:hypothetical protein PR048_026097 [Dryococelus australis]
MTYKAAFGGANTRDLEERVSGMKGGRVAKVVLIHVGGNDLAHREVGQEVERDLRGLLRKVWEKFPGARAVVSGVLVRKGVPYRKAVAMPKKFAGENSKAVAARARKTAAKEQEESRRKQQLEEEFWKDDDKHILKKQQKKEEQARKKQETLEKKAQSKALLEEELGSIKPSSKQPISKISQFQIQAENEKRKVAAGGKIKDKEPVTHIEKPLEENVNRILIEGEEARTVEEAIAVLSVTDAEVDRHRRSRATCCFTAIFASRKPEIGQAVPNLDLPQIAQTTFKTWWKVAENGSDECEG